MSCLLLSSRTARQPPILNSAEELDSLRRRVEAPANAAALAKAGVRFALVSDDLANPRDFINNIAAPLKPDSIRMPLSEP